MNILLVDDEMLAIEAICAKAPFQKYGITEVLTANSMKQAQEILRVKKADRDAKRQRSGAYGVDKRRLSGYCEADFKLS